MFAHLVFISESGGSSTIRLSRYALEAGQSNKHTHMCSLAVCTNDLDLWPDTYQPGLLAVLKAEELQMIERLSRLRSGRQSERNLTPGSSAGTYRRYTDEGKRSELDCCPTNRDRSDYA